MNSINIEQLTCLLQRDLIDESIERPIIDSIYHMFEGEDWNKISDIHTQAQKIIFFQVKIRIQQLFKDKLFILSK